MIRSNQVRELRNAQIVVQSSGGEKDHEGVKQRKVFVDAANEYEETGKADEDVAQVQAEKVRKFSASSKSLFLTLPWCVIEARRGDPRADVRLQQGDRGQGAGLAPLLQGGAGQVSHHRLAGLTITSLRTTSKSLA